MSKFLIAYIIVFLGGIGATFASDVCWGIYLYQLQYFLNPPVRWWGVFLPDLRYSFIIASCILIAFLIKSEKYSSNRLLFVPQTKWIMANYFIFALISMWAVWPQKHEESLILHTKLLFFIFIAYKVIDNSKKFEGMLWMFLIGNFYIGWVAKSTPRNFEGRLERIGPSDTPDGNDIASILISSVPILIVYIVNFKGWKKLIPALMLAYIVNAIVLINSRGGFVGLIVGCTYMGIHLILSRKILHKDKIKIIVFGVLCFSTFLYLADELFWTRMSTISESTDDEYAGGGRIVLWKLGIDLTKKYPLGVGTWGYQFLSPRFLPDEMIQTSSGRKAVHSLFVQALVERGYLGFIFFIAMLFSSIFFVRKVRKKLIERGELFTAYLGLAIESGYIAYLTACIFLSQLHAEILYWFQLFIACYGSIYLVKKTDSVLDFNSATTLQSENHKI